MADVEPGLLERAGSLPGGIPTGIVSKPMNVLTFGTPVTLGLRNALQTAQIASGILPSTCTVGNESEACMPSLSKGQLASIFSGNAIAWSEFGLRNSADSHIYIARHAASSDAHIAASVFFMNDVCADNMIQFVAGNLNKDGVIENSTKADACNASTASYGGTAVFEGAGGGDVETCLTNHDRNGRWAIGINSLDLPGVSDDNSLEYATTGTRLATGNTLPNKNYQRHIKIDGAAPTTFNVATGRYPFWYGQLLTRSPLTPNLIASGIG